jgi:hypothetical protein
MVAMLARARSKDRRRSASAGLVSIAAVAAAALAPALAFPRTAYAQSEDSREQARRLFGQGSSELVAKRYAEALEHLRVSYKLVPSPNSGLLIARCLRELNRPAEAVEMYSVVAVDARRRAADGDPKYQQTADAAASEGAAVRATLGTIRVRVSRPPPGSTVEIDGAAIPVTDTEIVVLHTPGEIAVKFRPRVGPEQSQRATLAAGADVLMEFVGPPRAAASEPSSSGSASASASAPTAASPAVVTPVNPPGANGEPPAWTLPATLVAGGVALVGAGIFVGFGLQSESIYKDLEKKCGAAGCTAADRSMADDGKRAQTIAAVGFAVGVVGVASMITFLLVRAYAPRTALATPTVYATAGGLGGTF